MHGLAPLILVLTVGPACPASAPNVLDVARVQSAQVETADTQKPSPTDDQTEENKPPTPRHTGVKALFRGLGQDFAHLPAKDNVIIALVGGAGALAAHPADAGLNQRLHSHYTFVNAIFAPGKYAGSTPVQLGAALGTFAVGRIKDQPKVSHLGMDLLRAQIVDEVLTEGLKLAVHRERPDHSNAQSFPSGHASVTFATATVIERHLGWRRSALAYLLASYVAASRLHDNRHYLSDVVFGAAVGTISGRTVTQHGRDTWTLAPMAVPGGVAVMVARTR